MPSQSPPSSSKPILVLGILLAAFAVTMICLLPSGEPGASTQAPGVEGAKGLSETLQSKVAPAKSNKPPVDPVVTAERARRFEWFTLRPFQVVKSSAAHEWTAEDGRNPDTIANLAHNELEVERLLEENDRIKRRQLVYRKETVPILLDRARNSGEPLRSFILPALDGKEVDVEVTDTQLNPAANAGSVRGRVKGRAGSMVSVGFANGCESFNVLSPEDGLYLTADAREPGEVLVKEIDPSEYSPPAGFTPDFILTDQPPPRIRAK